MTAFGKITKHQLKRLQTLYGQLQAHTTDGSTSSDPRVARLLWASQQIGRHIESFSDLTFSDARGLIDGLQGQLGVNAPPSKRKGRVAARRAGLDGRKDGGEFASAPQIVTQADLATIESYYLRLGWNRSQFDGWLASPHSPFGKRSSKAIATSADANRVRWALKGMLVQKGLWVKRNAK
jgi:hypothetical protein